MEGREAELRDAIGGQEERNPPRPQDQPSPSASRTSASGSARDSTHWKTVPESQFALDERDGHRPLLMEKSQASACPEGLRETQMSAGRLRSRLPGSEGQEEGGLHDWELREGGAPVFP